MAAFDSMLEGVLVLHVGLDWLDALLCQCFGIALGWISSDSTDLVLFGERWMSKNCFDDTAALNAGGTKHGEKFRHVSDLILCFGWGWVELRWSSRKLGRGVLQFTFVLEDRSRESGRLIVVGGMLYTLNELERGATVGIYVVVVGGRFDPRFCPTA